MSTAFRKEIKRFLKRVIAIGFSSLLGITLLAYAVDSLLFRYRVSTNRQPYGQVTITTYDAVAQKSGKVQFIFNPPQAVTCANSLFPQAGCAPCWYLQHHTERRTDI